MRNAIAVVGLLVLVACGGTTEPGQPQTLVGAFALCSISGKALPYVVDPNPSHTVAIMADTLALNGDSTFTDRQHRRLTVNGASSSLPVNDTWTPVAGLWRLAADSVRLRDATNDPLLHVPTEWYRGTFEATGRLTLIQSSGALFVYQRTNGAEC